MIVVIFNIIGNLYEYRFVFVVLSLSVSSPESSEFTLTPISIQKTVNHRKTISHVNYFKTTIMYELEGVYNDMIVNHFMLHNFGCWICYTMTGYKHEHELCFDKLGVMSHSG